MEQSNSQELEDNSPGIIDMLKKSNETQNSQTSRCKITELNNEGFNNVPKTFKGFGIMKNNIFNLVDPCLTKIYTTVPHEALTCHQPVKNISDDVKQLMDTSIKTIQMENDRRVNQTKELVTKLLKYLQDLYDL